MIKWILQDTKRNLLKKKTIILLLVMFASIASSFYTFLTPEVYYDHFGNEIVLGDPDIEPTEDDMLIMAMMSSYSLINNKVPECSLITAESSSAICDQYNTFKSNPEAKIEHNDDSLVFDREEVWAYFFINYAVYFNSFDTSLMERNPESADFFKDKIMNYDKIMEITKKTLENLPDDYELVVFDFGVQSTEELNSAAINFLEYYYLYENSLPMDAAMSLTGSFFISNYLNTFTPLLVIIGIILIFDSFYADYESGVIKTIMSSPTRRFRYLVLKSISAILSMLTVILIPILIVVIVLYIINGFETINYPVYISRNTLSSLEPVKKYSLVINAEMPGTAYSTFKDICTYGPVTRYVSDVASNPFGGGVACAIDANTFAAVPLSQYLGLVAIYIVLIVVFLASLNSLLSIIFNKSILNLTVLILIVAGGLTIANIFIGKSFLNYLPTSFLSPTQLIMGTVPFTYYHGVVILSSYTVLITLVNFVLIKRKDFSY